MIQCVLILKSLVLELWDRVYVACCVARDVLGIFDPTLHTTDFSLNLNKLVDEVYDDLQLL